MAKKEKTAKADTKAQIIAKNIRRWRTTRNMSQKELGDGSQQMAAKWESGVVLPTRESLEKIARKLTITIDDLLEGTEAPGSSTMLDRLLAVNAENAQLKSELTQLKVQLAEYEKKMQAYQVLFPKQ